MNKKRKWLLLYFLAFVIPVSAMLAHMFLTNCYPFGENTIMIRDADIQYVPFLKYMVAKIKSGGSLQFDWHSGLGADYYTTFFYYLASPFNWLMFIFGKNNLDLGALCVFLVQIGGCGMTALYLFGNSKYNRLDEGKDIISLLFSVAYAMCGYILAYQYNFMWLISLMLAPLVMIGIEKVVDKKDYKLYFATLLLVFVTNFYFAWYICILSAIYFIDQSFDNVKQFFSKLLKFAFVSLVSALCAAFVLVPCYLSVLKRDVGSDWYTWSNLDYGYFGKPSDFFYGFLFGGKIDSMGGSFFVNNNYCGIFTLVLVLVFFFNQHIERKYKIKRILELIILSVMFNWIVGSYILQGFTIPHFYISRFMFILIIMLLITALESLDGVETVRYRYLLVSFGCLGIVYMIGVLGTSETGTVFGILTTTLLGVYYFICIVLFKRKSIRKISFYLNIFIFGILELFVNAIISNEKNFNYSNLKLVNYDDWSTIYETLETSKGERKSAWIGDMYTAYCGDASIFSSAINTDVLKFYRNLGLVGQKNGGVYIYRGTTPISTSLFNVKYVLTDNSYLFGGYKVKDKIGNYTTLEPEGNVNFGEVFPETMLDWKCNVIGEFAQGVEVTPMDVQNELTDDIMGIGDAFSEYVPDEINVSSERCMVLGRRKKLTDFGMPRYLKKRDGIWYQNMNINSDLDAIVYIDFKVEKAGDLYAYIYDDNNSIRYDVQIDGQEVTTDLYKNSTGLVHIGNVKKGQEVQISVANTSDALEYGVTTVKLYSLDQDVVDKYYDLINQSVFKVDSFQDTEITGSVDAKEDGILYTSIPYYRGFKVYIDGEKAEIVKVGNAMIGVRIDKGKHNIRIKYRTYGLVTGLIITAAGWILVAFFVIRRRRKNG